MAKDPTPACNLLFQSERHPLVKLEHESRASYCLSLIHRAAYVRAAGMAEGLNVLDVGCNNGYGTLVIAERCRHIIGVDVSPRAIEAAQQEHAASNVSYQLVDGDVLPFADNSFDLVTSFQVIEHVEAVIPYLREICRVMRNPGRAIFTTPNRCIRLDPGMKPWNEFHVTEYDANTLASVLSGAFATVIVEGLLAAPELYNLERERAHTARATARKLQAASSVIDDAVEKSPPSRGQLRQVWRATRRRLRRLRKWPEIKRAMAEAKVAELERARLREAERAALPMFMQRWSVSDLYYSDCDLDGALDLMAICATKRRA